LPLGSAGRHRSCDSRAGLAGCVNELSRARAEIDVAPLKHRPRTGRGRSNSTSRHRHHDVGDRDPEFGEGPPATDNTCGGAPGTMMPSMRNKTESRRLKRRSEVPSGFEKPPPRSSEEAKNLETTALSALWPIERFLWGRVLRRQIEAGQGSTFGKNFGKYGSRGACGCRGWHPEPLNRTFQETRSDQEGGKSNPIAWEVDSVGDPLGGQRVVSVGYVRTYVRTYVLTHRPVAHHHQPTNIRVDKTPRPERRAPMWRADSPQVRRDM